MAVAKLDEWVQNTAQITLTRTISAGNQRCMVAVFATRRGGSLASQVDSADFGGQPMILIVKRAVFAGAARIHISAWYILEDGIAARTDDVITPIFTNDPPARTIIGAAVFSDVNQNFVIAERNKDFTNASTPNPFTPTLDILAPPENWVIGAVCSIPNTTTSWNADLTEVFDVNDNNVNCSLAEADPTVAQNFKVRATMASQSKATAISFELSGLATSAKFVVYHEDFTSVKDSILYTGDQVLLYNCEINFIDRTGTLDGTQPNVYQTLDEVWADSKFAGHTWVYYDGLAALDIESLTHPVIDVVYVVPSRFIGYDNKTVAQLNGLTYKTAGIQLSTHRFFSINYIGYVASLRNKQEGAP